MLDRLVPRRSNIMPIPLSVLTVFIAANGIRTVYTLCMLMVGGIIYLFFKIRVLTYNHDLIREFKVSLRVEGLRVEIGR